MAMFQSLQLVSDLKLGWYTSIPPREMFAAQILGTVLGALTNCTYRERTSRGRACELPEQSGEQKHSCMVEPS